MSTDAEGQRARRARRAVEAGREPGRPGRPRSAVCGTAGGWRAHQRDRTESCQACRDAWAAYIRARRG